MLGSFSLTVLLHLPSEGVNWGGLGGFWISGGTKGPLGFFWLRLFYRVLWAFNGFHEVFLEDSLITLFIC